MLMVPDWIDPEMVRSCCRAVGAKGRRRGSRRPLETLAEGRCVQTLHVGSYDDEAAVLAQLHDEFIPATGCGCGTHHEIYLSDP